MPSSSIELTSEQIEQFQNDGAIYLPNVFDTKWVESAKVAIDKVMANPSPYGESLRPVENEGSYFNDYCNWQRIPELRDYVYNSPAAELVGKLMKSDIW